MEMEKVECVKQGDCLCCGWEEQEANSHFLGGSPLERGNGEEQGKVRVKSFRGSHIWWTAAGSARLPSR